MKMKCTTWQLSSAGGWHHLDTVVGEPGEFADNHCSNAVAEILNEFPDGTVSVTNGAAVYDEKRKWTYEVVEEWRAKKSGR